MGKVDVWILGGGGHAKVVHNAGTKCGVAVSGALDDRSFTTIPGLRVDGPISVETFDRLNIQCAVIAIGSNRVRHSLAECFSERLEWITIVHPSTVIAEDVTIGPGTVVFAGAIVQPGARIGAHVILNTACSADHDCVVEDFVHLAPGVRLAGNVHVGEGAFLGIGSCVIPGVRIGRWATVGAGAAVIENVPDHATVVGVPARVIKTGEEPA